MAEAFAKLILQLRNYQGEIRSALLREARFDREDEDHMACEKRRRMIERLLTKLGVEIA